MTSSPAAKMKSPLPPRPPLKRKLSVESVASDNSSTAVNSLDSGVKQFEYPPKDCVKLNTDGCSNDDGSGEGMSGGGGLIRSSTGHSYLQFRGQLGISTPLLAELWALDKGLDFIITMGFKRVVIGVENEDIIKGMKDESWKDDLSGDGNVLEYITRDPETATKKYYMLNIKSVLNNPSIDFEVHQILPEGNIVADGLAAKAMESGEFILRNFDESAYLKRLKLWGCIVAPRGIIEWPSLTELHIKESELQQHVMEKMLSGCPVLRCLVLLYCCGFDRLEVSSKSLYELHLQISAPYLHTLWVALYPIRRKLCLENTPSLVRATLDFILGDWDFRNKDLISNAKELFEKISHVKGVDLGYSYMQALSLVAINGVQYTCPCRRRLSHLLGVSLASLDYLMFEFIFVLPHTCIDSKIGLDCDLLPKNLRIKLLLVNQCLPWPEFDVNELSEVFKSSSPSQLMFVYCQPCNSVVIALDLCI
ncbi:TRAFAC class myosin-kinesin ATPase superfamily [Castilleja foliolosa]|uniref:TRAFAC class myosin-kinesin ATPase superfamily n=1 Tax=Castilleja foliolosa TaxID=1961234 RepID=A0ABD3BTI4_9LAMI